jgi:3'-5' exoribonuclease
VVIGRDLLKECCAALGDVPEDLELHLEHLVLSHQGKREFAAPVEPMTPEALVLHFVDDLDSKLNQLDRARLDGGGLQWSRGLGRYVYLARHEEREVVEVGDGPGDEAPERTERTERTVETLVVEAGPAAHPPEPPGEAGDVGAGDEPPRATVDEMPADRGLFD